MSEMTPSERYAVARALEGLSDGEACRVAGLSGRPSAHARDLTRRLRSIRSVPEEVRRAEDYAARAAKARKRARDLDVWARVCTLRKSCAPGESA